jgi:hypothetical protein
MKSKQTILTILTTRARSTSSNWQHLLPLPTWIQSFKKHKWLTLLSAMDVFLIRLVSLHPYQTTLTTSMRTPKRAHGLRELRQSRKLRHGSPHGLRRFQDALLVGNSTGLFSILQSLHQWSILKLELDSKQQFMNELQSINSTSLRFQWMCFGLLQNRRSCHSKLPCHLQLRITHMINKSGGYMLSKKASSRHMRIERDQLTSL